MVELINTEHSTIMTYCGESHLGKSQYGTTVELNMHR